MEISSEAVNALHKVDDLAARLGAAEGMLERGYAEFAEALLLVQENRYWENDHHESWGDYMRFVTEKFKLGRAQLYHKVAVVRELKGVVQSSDLTDMGISKASVLADVHRASGELPENAIESAKNTTITVKQLKQSLAEALHMPAEEAGEWLDLNYAFFVTEEEKAEIQEAEDIVRFLDPPISNSIKDFQQRKEIVLRFAREILGTYSEQAEPSELILDIPYVEVEDTDLENVL